MNNKSPSGDPAKPRHTREGVILVLQSEFDYTAEAAGKGYDRLIGSEFSPPMNLSNRCMAIEVYRMQGGSIASVEWDSFLYGNDEK